MRERLRCFDLHPCIDSARLAAHRSSFMVARDRWGVVVATLGSWDPHAIKRPVILGCGMPERLLRFTLNALLGAAGHPAIPAAGRPLRVLYALCPLAAPGHEAALAQLLARLRRSSREHTALLIAGYAEDPPLRAVRNYIRFTNVNIPFLTPLDPGSAATEGPRSLGPAYVEYAFL